MSHADNQDRFPKALSMVIRIGGLSRAEILREFERHSVRMNAYGETLFKQLRFESYPSVEQREVVELTVREMGFAHAVNYSEVLARAESLGLKLCSLEAAPYLRLQYLNQPPDGTHITIASPIRSEPPSGFYLRHQPGTLWLRGYVASADYEWNPDERFLFLR